jgi:hypothetical protein
MLSEVQPVTACVIAVDACHIRIILPPGLIKCSDYKITTDLAVEWDY